MNNNQLNSTADEEWMLTQLVLCLHNEKFSFVLENCQVVGEWGLLLPEHYLVGKKITQFLF